MPSRAQNCPVLFIAWIFAVTLWVCGALPARGQVAINEILADNRITVSNGDTFSDYVELVSLSSQAVNLSGMSLTDDFNQPRKYVFPANAILAAGGYLIVWCDDLTNSPGIHTGFGLNTRGESVGLYNSAGVLVDSVVFGLQLPDLSLGRIPNATGAWTLNLPTPAKANVAQALGLPTALKINEWMANDSPDPDWIELYNATNLPVALGDLVFSDVLATPSVNRPVPPLSFIGGNAFSQFWADSLAVTNAEHLDFKLNSATGETVSLYDSNKSSLLDRVSYGPQTLNVSQGRLPDGGTNFVFFPARKPTPAASNFLPVTNLVINELLPHTDPPLEDAVELYNPTAEPVDIGNWWLSNHREDPMRYRIPAGTIVPAGGYKVIYEFEFNPLGLGFTFNSYESGEVVLCSGDSTGALTGYRLRQQFEPSQNGVSFGRFQTSLGFSFAAMSERTFGVDTPASLVEFRAGAGKTNSYARIGPVIINEVMYHPLDLMVDGKAVNDTANEYIELFNTAAVPTPLFDPLYPTNQWRIRNAVSFDFPANYTMPARSYLLVVGFNPASATQLEAFRTHYGISNGIPILGPFVSGLNHRSAAIELQKPDAPQAWDRPKPGLVPFIQVDRLDYEDRDPWPATPDGSGYSLQRRSALVYGNDPVHWLGALPTPGRANAVEAPKIEGPSIDSKRTIQFQFTALAGVAYSATWQTDLASSAAQTLTNIPAALVDRPIVVTDSASTNTPSRFYRINVPAP